MDASTAPSLPSILPSRSQLDLAAKPRKEHPMNILHKNGAEAWPIAHETGDHWPVLSKIVVASRRHGAGGKVHLTPNQAIYAQSRLSIIKTAFLNGHSNAVHGLGTDHLPDDHASHLTNCGAKVWPILAEEGTSSEVLQSVVLESQHSDGYGMVSLSPEEARHIEERLTQITLAFLHDNVWGGEDALRQ
jgi:hypothetical protein